MRCIEYFTQCINTDYLYKLDWYYAIFTIAKKDNKYVKHTESGIQVWLNDEWKELTDYRKDLPILLFNDRLTLNKGDLPNITTKIDTTVGRVIFNYVLVARNFGSKIPYFNEQVDVEAIEKYITKGLVDNTILVSEYLRYTDSVSFIEQLSPISNISATYKNVLPPPNLDKIKKDLYKQFDSKYGPDWKKDRGRVVEFQEELKKVDAEWLKGDPSVGKLITGKIKDNARVKMYLTFGPEVGFHKDGSKTTFVENSLLEQYPKDKEQVAAIYNSIRAASYDRGAETAKGGAASKDVLRGLSSYRVVKGDCKSKQYRKITVTKEIANGLSGRYMVVNDKLVEITDPTTLIGKTIQIRSPMYCKQPSPEYCSTCCGTLIENVQDAIPSIGASITGEIMYIAMKSMHNTQVSLKDVNITDTFV